MSRNCFKGIKVGDLAKRFEESISEDMTDEQIRDIGTKLVTDYYNKLDNDLVNLNKKAGNKAAKPSPVKYEPQKSDTDIVEENNARIAEIDNELAPLNKKNTLTKSEQRKKDRLDKELADLKKTNDSLQSNQSNKPKGESAKQAPKTEAPKTEGNKKDTYVAELKETKASDPEQYWSVSDVSKEDAEKGTLIDTEDGSALVKEDGDIVGVFKKLSSSARGVAQDLLKRAVAAGGNKLDNFDGYLTKQYKKAGFRVVSRTPFNEQYAPDGWNKEKHGTPDVVAMVYDPNNELDIEEKTFTDPETGYDDAIAYRDSILESKTKSESNNTVDDLLNDLDSFMADDTKTQDGDAAVKNTEAQKKSILDKIKAAAKAISVIAPNVKIVAHKTTEEYNAAAEGDLPSNGEWNPNTNTIIINLETANSRTVAHEVLHAVLGSRISNDADIQALTDKFLEVLERNLDGDVKSELKAFTDKYNEGVRSEEAIAELTGMLAENYASLSVKAKSAIKEWLDNIAKALGLKEFTDSEVVDLLNTLSSKIASGDVINESDINTLGVVGNVDPKNAKRLPKQSRLNYVALKRFPEHENVTVKRDVPLKNFTGKDFNVIESDRMTGAYIPDSEGRPMFKFLGGIYFPVITGKWWASSNLSKAKQIASAATRARNSDGYIYTAPVLSNAGSHMSNRDMFETAWQFMKSDLSKGKLTKDAFLKLIDGALNLTKLKRYVEPYTGKKVGYNWFKSKAAYKLYAQDLNIKWNKKWNEKGGLDKIPENIMSSFQEMASKKLNESEYIDLSKELGLKKSNTIEQITTKLDELMHNSDLMTFEQRKALIGSLLGSPTKKDARNFPSAGSLIEFASKFEETDTQKADEGSGNMVMVMRTKGDLLAKKTPKSDEWFHNSYPAEIYSTAPIEVLFFDAAYNIKDVLPSMTKQDGTEFSWAEYEKKHGEVSQKYALSQYARTSSKLSFAKGTVTPRQVKSQIAQSPAASNFSKASTAELFANPDVLEVQRQKNGRVSVLDMGRALDRRSIVEGYHIPVPKNGVYTDAQLEQISDAMTDDVTLQLLQDDSGIGWYDTKTKSAMELMSRIHPELKDQKSEAYLKFTLLVAFISQNNTVSINFKQANDAYTQLKKTGDISKKVYAGKSGKIIRNNINAALAKIAKDGADSFRAILDSEKTVGEWKKLGYKVNGENVSTKLTGAQVIMGSKIGSFWGNLNGDFSTLTADLWFSRTFNRYTGNTVAKKNTESSKSSVLEALESYEGTDLLYGYNKKTLLKGGEVFEKWLSTASKAYAKGNYKDKQDLNVKINTHVKNVKGSLQDIPRGGNEREAMRKVVKMVQDKLMDRGYPKLDIADIQAILWYNEKDLYRQYKAVNKSSEKTDYETAAQEVLREQGVNADVALQFQRGESRTDGDGNRTSDGESKTPSKGRQVKTQSTGKSINEIIDFAKGKGYDTKTIRDALKKKGFSDAEIDAALPKPKPKPKPKKKSKTKTDSKADSKAPEGKKESKLVNTTKKAGFNVPDSKDNYYDPMNLENVEAELNAMSDAELRTVFNSDSNKAVAAGVILYKRQVDAKDSESLETWKQLRGKVTQYGQLISQLIMLKGSPDGIVQMVVETLKDKGRQASKEKFEKAAKKKPKKTSKERAAKVKESTQKLADKIRSIKPHKSFLDSMKNLSSDPTGSQVAISIALEAAAKSVELTGNIYVAIEAGMDAFMKSDFYKNLKKDKPAAESYMRNELESQILALDPTAKETAKAFEALQPNSSQMERLQEMAEELVAANNEYNEMTMKAVAGDQTITSKDVKAAEKRANNAIRDFNKVVSTMIPRTWGDILSTSMQGGLLTVKSLEKNPVYNLFGMMFDVPKRVLSETFRSIDSLVRRFAGKEPRTGKDGIPHITLRAFLHGTKVMFTEGFPIAFRAIAFGSNNSAGNFKFEQGRSFLPARAFIASLSNTKVGDSLGIPRDMLAVNEKGKIPLSDRMKKLTEGTIGWFPEAAFRLLPLGDAPFVKFYEGMELSLAATALKLEGKERSNFLKYPSNAHLERAKKVADKAVFQEDSKVAKIVSNVLEGIPDSLRKSAKENNPVAKWSLNFAANTLQFFFRSQVPFMKIPINVIAQTLDYAVPVIPLGRGVHKATKGDVKGATEDMAKFVIGSVMTYVVSDLVLAGLVMGASGGDEEDDKRVRAMGYLGRQPSNSINIDGLKRYIAAGGLFGGEEAKKAAAWKEGDASTNYQSWGFLGSMMGIHSNFAPKTLKPLKNRLSIQPELEKSINVYSWGNVPRVMAYAVDQSFLKGTSALLKVLQDGSDYERLNWVGNMTKAMTSAVLPNTFVQASRYQNEYLPDLRADNAKDQAINIIKDRMFWLNSGLPIRVDIAGNKIKNTPTGRDPLMTQFFDFWNPKSEKFSPELKRANDLFEKTRDPAVFPYYPSDVINNWVDEKDGSIEEWPLEGQDKQDYFSEWQKLKIKNMKAAFDMPAWEKMNPIQQADYLKKVIRDSYVARTPEGRKIQTKWVKVSKKHLMEKKRAYEKGK